MKKTIVVFILISLFFICCGKKKDVVKAPSADIISIDEMESVMVDVMLAEGAIGIGEVKHQDEAYNTKRYYNLVFEKHHITREQFVKSYAYYSSEIKQMDKIMNEVVDDLSQMQSKVRNE